MKTLSQTLHSRDRRSNKFYYPPATIRHPRRYDAPPPSPSELLVQEQDEDLRAEDPKPAELREAMKEVNFFNVARQPVTWSKSIAGWTLWSM